MSEAQSWTLLVGFLAILGTMVGMALRIVRVEIQSLRFDLGGRIDRLEVRLGHLDRDVQTVINRLMGG